MTSQHKLAGASPGKTAIAVVLLCALALISGLLYSPWHRHNSASRQACLFSPVEACSTLPPGSLIQLQPVFDLVWIMTVWAVALPLVHHCSPRFGRAPPA